MKMNKGLFCGFNGFYQFGTTHARKTNDLCKLPEEWIEGDDSKYALSWSFNAYSHERTVIVSGFVKGAPGNQESFTVPEKVKTIAATGSHCLVLLENGDLYQIAVSTCKLEKLNFTNTERAPKRGIFGEEKHESTSSEIEFLACGRYICVAITRSNIVYNVPTKVFEFPKHVKIKMLSCGFEHALVLTSNGDVYSWGNGLRGQLGHADIGVVENPVLIEALAGVKIVSLSAGGWHSAAISSFGDVYVWGSNVNGQLGIAIYTQTARDGENVFKRKNPTVYPLPQIVDIGLCCENEGKDSCDIVQVSCGGRHTFIMNECGKVYCSGWNEYNQLAQGSMSKYFDKFTLLETEKDFQVCRVYCGPWCTVFTNK